MGAVLAPVLREGELFADRYEVEGVLGTGGMAVVYRVRDRQLGDVVALKILTQALNAADAERFRREVRLARRITHPNVARIHDIGEHDGALFLTMEWVDGDDLDAVMAEGLTLAQAVSFGVAICRGLQAAHEAGVVHRDLKPANVLVDKQGRVLLTDFGIARSMSAERVTKQTAIIGTPAYMAPEQVLGAELDARCDVYAFGLVLYEMLTGTLPFLRDSDNAMAATMARCAKPAEDPREHAAVPDELADLVLRCLQLVPDDRPTCAEEVAEALEHFCSNDSGHVRAPASVRRLEWKSAVENMHTSAPFSVLSQSSSTLAVLPFRYRGPAEDDYLGDSLAEELTDVLSRTRGLRIIAFSAVEAWRDRRDPIQLAQGLGVDAVVDGAVHRSGARVVVSARLMETPSGVQAWSDRFEAAIEDVFKMQQSISQRIAEALRVRVEASSFSTSISAEAMELYLRARQGMRRHAFTTDEGAIALLERCIALAPNFQPALAAHALGCLRAMWTDITERERNWLVEAEASVARAKRLAPDLAETHVATAILENQLGHPAAAVQALLRALEIAPTHAEAHCYLGEIQCEGGRVDKGTGHIELSLELDPSRANLHITLARHHELEGRHDACDEAFATGSELCGATTPGVMMTGVRIAAWRGDHARLRTLTERAALAGEPGVVIADFGRYMLGDTTTLTEHQTVAAMKTSRRFAALMHQVATEAHALAGQAELALARLEAATNRGLFDIHWLSRCPALDSLRDDARFRTIHKIIEARAAMIWQRHGD